MWMSTTTKLSLLTVLLLLLFLSILSLQQALCFEQLALPYPMVPHWSLNFDTCSFFYFKVEKTERGSDREKWLEQWLARKGLQACNEHPWSQLFLGAFIDMVMSMLQETQRIIELFLDPFWVSSRQAGHSSNTEKHSLGAHGHYLALPARLIVRIHYQS